MGWRTRAFWDALCGMKSKSRDHRANCKQTHPRRSLRFEQCEDRRMLATFTVNSLLDNGDGTNITLREAVDASNLSLDPEDIIIFDQSVFSNGDPIELTQGQITISETTRLVIDASMLTNGIIIDASGNDPTPTVNNGDGSRIFDITAGEIELIALTLTGGDSSNEAGRFAGGGALRSVGVLTIRDCLFTGSRSQNGDSLIVQFTLAA